MVSSRGVSAGICAAVGLLCFVSVVRGHRSDAGAKVTIADAPTLPASPPAAAAGAAAVVAAAPVASPPSVEIDTALATGSIAPGSAVHVPNPAAYKGAPRMGDPVTVAGAEAINYLAGNTLRREGPGEPLRLTYFASRGLMGEGDERGFTARRWDRERPELCEADGGDGATCRSVSILLDGKYEFPGARLGTVTLGAAGGRAAETAVLVKGNALHFPEHIPFLDSTVEVAAAEDAPGATRRGDPLEALAGHAVAVAGEGARDVVYYARDDRRFALRQVQDGDAKAVAVTVGHWHAAKAALCQAAVVGGPQSCFKAEAAGGGVRLVPTGRGGEAQTLTVLPETGAREVAQD